MKHITSNKLSATAVPIGPPIQLSRFHFTDSTLKRGRPVKSSISGKIGRYLTLYYCLLSAFAVAQIPNCESTVPTFVVDFSTNLGTTFITPPLYREGHCCGQGGSDECLNFEMTIDTNNAGVSFEIVEGAQPSGSMFYQIDCSTPININQIGCISSPGVHYVTFCKPGSNLNRYALTSVPKPTFRDDTVAVGCWDTLPVFGIKDSLAVYTSIFPGSIGQYNNLLSCTSGCAKVRFTPNASTPAQIRYRVCGYALASNCVGTQYYCDTITVTILPNWSTASDQVICAPATTASLGNAPPGSRWRILPGNPSPALIDSLTGQVSGLTLEGNYFFLLQTLQQNCTDTVKITKGSKPNAGIDQSLCLPQTTTSLGAAPSGFSWSALSGNPATATVGSSSGNVSGMTIPGTYFFSLSASSGCADTVQVLLKPRPATPNAGSNSPVCTGDTLFFTATADTGVTYLWSGPNGFSSSVANPFKPAVVLADGGLYSVIVQKNSCWSIADSVLVTINQTPAQPVIVSNSPVCSGQTLTLNTSAVAGATYQWSGPNGYSGSTQNISRPNADSSFAGNYNLIITVLNCSSPAGNSSAVIKPTPTTPVAGSNSPICAGQTLTLQASSTAGSTYSWTGPGGFSSSQQNPGISNATTAASGSYSVNALLNGCTSATTSLSVTVKPTPAPPVLSTNGIRCSGDTLKLFSSFISGVNYAWSGPSGFTSTAQNPVIPNAQPTNSGTYRLTVTLNGCPNLIPDSILAQVNPCPPVAVNDVYQTNEDQTLSVNAGSGLLSNDFDPASPPQAISVNGTPVSLPQHGSVSLLSSGAFTYIPQANYFGSDTFQYRVCDIESPPRCDTGTVFIQIVAVNDAPVVNNQQVTTPEDQPITVCLPISDIENNQLHQATICQSPLHGSISNPLVNNSSSPHQVCFTYTPSANYNGADSVCLIVCDNGQPNRCDTAKVFIEITPVNDSPVAQNDLYTVSQDTAITRNAAANDADPDGPGVHITLTCSPTYGNVVLQSNGTFTYTPPVNFGLTDSFCYVYCDSGNPNLCDAAVVYLDYTGSNLPPIAQNDFFTTPEDQTLNGNVRTNDTDPNNGSTLTVSTTPVVNTQHGSLSILSNGTFQYIPAPQYFGGDTFQYKICDNGLPVKCDTGTVFITVTPVNDPPVVSDTIVQTTEDIPLTVCLPIQDIESFDLHFTLIQTQPAHGQITAFSNNNSSVPHTTCIQYQPTVNYNGVDSIRIIVCDNGVPGKCDTASIRITILPVNDPPVANTDQFTGDEDQLITGNVLTNDTDPDGPNLQVTGLSCQPAHGSVLISTAGLLSYQPNPNYFGADTLCYIVCDQGSPNRCDTGTVTINILPKNDAPVLSDTTFTVFEGQLISACLPIIDPDVTDVHAGSNCGIPGIGSLLFNGVQNNTTPHTLCFSYNAPTDYSGIQSSCFIVCDNGIPGKCDTGIVTFIILPVNDAPQTDTVWVSTPMNIPVGVNVSASSNDPEGHPLTFTYGNISNGGASYTSTGNGSILLTPPTNFTGVLTLPFTVCDQSPYAAFSLCDSSVIIVQVTPPGDTLVNHSPIASSDFVTTPMGTSVTINVLANDIDPDGDVLQTSLALGGGQGVVTLNNSGQFSFTPAAGFIGADTFYYTVCDPFGFTQPRPLCATGQIIVVVTADSAASVNDPPVAVADVQQICSDGAAYFTPSLNDSDPNGNPISIPIIIQNPANGIISNTGNGTFLYDPAAGFAGTDSILYVICDQGLPSLCDTGLILVQVLANPIVYPTDTGLILCDGDSLHFPFTISPAGAVVSWTSSEGLSGTGSIHTLVNNGTTLPKNIIYTVSALSAGGCGSAVGRIVVSVLPKPQVTTTTLNTTICSEDAVSILLSASIPGSSFSWWSSAGASGTGNVVYDQPQNTSTSVIPITYSIVAQAGGCAGDTVLQVIQVKPRPVITISSPPQAVCSGTPVQISFQSSLQGTTYFWSSTSGLYGSSAVINDQPVNISNGFPITVSYLINAQTNGCSGTQAFTAVTVWPQPVADAGLDQTLLSCSNTLSYLGGSPAGSGGTAPYTYAWSPAQGLNDSSVAQPLIAGNTASNYTLTVTDVHGCSATDAVNVNQTNSGLMAEAGLGGSICSNGTDSVVLGGTPTATGGDPIYTYSWFPGTGLNLNNVANPSARPDTTTRYVLTITDENGCSAQDSVLVIVKPAPVADAGKDTTVCLQSTLQIGGTPAGSGGSGNGYLYSWSPVVGVVIPAIANPLVTPSGSTTYSLTVTDINGCTATDNIVVQTIAIPTADAGPDKTIYSCGQSATYLGGTPSGTGTDALTYEWSPSTGLDDATLPNPQVNGLDISTLFTLTVRSGRTGCAATDQVLVNVAESSLSIEAGQAHVLCPQSNGGVTLGGMPTVTGGQSPYQFSWSPSAGLTDTQSANPIANPQSSTTYVLQVTDHNGCVATDSVQIDVFSYPVISVFGLSQSFCADAGNVTLSAEPDGGVFSGPGITGNSFLPSTLSPGEWCVTYTYTYPAVGCVQDTQICVRIDSVPHIVVSGLESAYCRNDLPVVLSAQPTGGTFSGPGIVDNTFRPDEANTGENIIQYTYSDRLSGCTNDIQLIVQVKNNPLLQAQTSSTDICPGTPITAFAQYSLDILNIQWTDLQGNTLYSGLNNVSVTPEAGNNCFIATAQNDEGCRSSDTACVLLLNCSIKANDEPCEEDSTLMNTPISIRVLANDELPEGRDTTVQIAGAVVNGQAIVQEDNSVQFTPYVNAFGFGSFEYIVCVDTNGSRVCDTAFVCVVIVDPTIRCKFPNTITPNQDGINDQLEISCNEEYPQATMRIFNRWGTEVYRSEGHYDNRWNGQNQEGENVVDGTYFFIYTFNDGSDRIEKGFIDIYR